MLSSHDSNIFLNIIKSFLEISNKKYDVKNIVIIFNLVLLLLKRKSISESKNITLGNKKKRC